MSMKTVTMRRIAILLVAAGVISAIIGNIVVWIAPVHLWIFSADASGCRFTQSVGCQLTTEAPEYGLVLIAIGAILYMSTRTKKAGAVGKETSSQVPPSQI